MTRKLDRQKVRAFDILQKAIGKKCRSKLEDFKNEDA